MVDCTTEDLVVLHLDHYEPVPDEGLVPFEFSIPGIGEALDVGVDAMAERITLLSALSTLKGEGLVVERTSRVDGLDGERNVYAPTAEGRERARDLRESVADRRIRVENGTATEVELRSVDRYLDEPALVRALARLTDEDVLYLEESVDRRFVDRETELRELETDLDAVADGEGRGVLVAGEAGVGKTTLVAELLSAAEDRDFQVLEGVCRRDTSEPYRPFREALEPAVPEPRLRALFGGGPEAEDPETFAAQRAAMFADVADAIEDLAAIAPVVLFVDDLHSADEPTMAMFEALAADVEEGVLLVGTYRPEDLPGEHPLAGVSDDWTDRDDRSVLDLAPFGREETRGLLEWLVGTRRLPAEFVDLVYQGTGGNPLFVTESTKRMLDRGTVEPEYDVYPRDEDAIPIPDRVENAIDIRLEVLDERADRVLSLGSLIGETIAPAVLAAASDLDEPELREYVDLLVDSHVWERTDGDRIRFASGLIRETVAARIGDRERRRLHERIAAAMADVYEDDPSEHAAAAAHHYRNAGADGEALEHYLTAAEHARDVYAHEAAVENYERALEVARELDDDEAILTILEEIGRVNRVIGEFEAANRYFGFVRERTEDTETLQRIARLQSRMAALKGDYDGAIEHADRGLALAVDEDAPETCRLLDHKGWALMQQGEFDAAERVLDRAHGMAERIDDPELEALTLHNRASVAMSRGTADEETLDTFEEAATIRERIGDRRGLAETYNNLGATYMMHNEVDEARRALERCLELNEEMGNRSGVLSALNNLGTVYERDDDYDRALSSYRRALEEARTIGARQTVANALANVGTILFYERNDPEAAIDRLERSLSIQRDIDNKRWQVAINRDLAQIHAVRNDLSVARERAERALDVATETGMPAQRASALRILGDIEDERGDHEAAIERHEASLDVAREIDTPDQAVLARLSMVDPLIAAGRPGEAREQIREARTTIEERTSDLADQQVETLPAVLAAAEGRCHGAHDEYDQGAVAFDDALERARNQDLDRYEAQVLYDRGKLERDRGDHDAAIGFLERARARAEEGGSALTARKCRELIADLDADA